MNSTLKIAQRNEQMNRYSPKVAQRQEAGTENKLNVLSLVC